jgi:hypothetical protein
MYKPLIQILIWSDKSFNTRSYGKTKIFFAWETTDFFEAKQCMLNQELPFVDHNFVLFLR